ncbi:hypothetical protein V6Z11_D06G235200 [Gossypium hirsutum]
MGRVGHPNICSSIPVETLTQVFQASKWFKVRIKSRIFRYRVEYRQSSLQRVINKLRIGRRARVQINFLVNKIRLFMF